MFIPPGIAWLKVERHVLAEIAFVVVTTKVYTAVKHGETDRVSDFGGLS